MTKRKATRSKPTPLEIAAKGGKARAEALTPDRKQEIAKQGAMARWRGKPIKAIHAGTLRLGTAEIPCANLPDGRRVLSEAAILAALGRGYSGYYSQRDAAAAGTGAVEGMHRAVSPKVLSPFIPAELAEMLAQPIPYQAPKAGGVSKGIPADALPLICETWIKARDAGVLTDRQRQTADAAELIRRGLTHVGIAALVDEATGAQYERARFALATFLESFVTKDLAAYGKTFDDPFYKEMFRLRGWDISKFEKRPGVVGKWTTDIVYKRLAPGVLQRLQEIIPRDPNTGRLTAKWYRALTQDKGYIALKEHLSSVTTIMKLADNWTWFLQKLDQLHPRYEPQLLLPFMTKQIEQKGADEDE